MPTVNVSMYFTDEEYRNKYFPHKKIIQDKVKKYVIRMLKRL